LASALAALMLLRPGISDTFAVSVAEPASSEPQAAAAADAARGKALYLAHQCWACHGYTGETGTRLLQENGSFAARLSSVDRFVAYIRAPNPTQPPPLRSLTSMPSYGAASLPDAQAAELYAYIRTLKPNQPPLSEIPLLTQMSKEGGRPKK
jgi:mono/diheme cytochrome c family protein